MSSILVVLALPVVLLFAWFCIEFARVHRHAGRAKLAADAAALAAAARYADGAAVARADAIAAAGGQSGPKGPLTLVVADGPGGGGDLEFGDWDPDARSFIPNAEGGKAVRVTVRLSEDHPNGGVPMLLSGLFDIPPASLTRSSVATFRAPTHTTSLLLADDGASLLTVGGGAAVRARGGISMPNDDAAAIAIGPDAEIDVPVLRAAGNVGEEVAGRVDGEVQQGAAIPVDPFAGVDVPAIVGSAPVADVEHLDGGTLTLAPGVHGSLSATTGVVVLAPGLHQFTGDISLRGTAVLELDGATVQLAEASILELTGSATIRGTGGSVDSAWGGHAILQRPGSVQWSIGSGASVVLSGRVYAPGARLSASGSAVFRASSAVMHSVAMSDSARLRLDADIDEVQLPASQGRARLLR
jgi:hypothetical protein